MLSAEVTAPGEVGGRGVGFSHGKRRAFIALTTSVAVAAPATTPPMKAVRLRVPESLSGSRGWSSSSAPDRPRLARAGAVTAAARVAEWASETAERSSSRRLDPGAGLEIAVETPGAVASCADARPPDRMTRTGPARGSRS